MISLLITAIIVCLLVALAYYVLDAVPVPDPLNRIAKIAIVVIGCLIIIMMLAQLAGYDVGFPRPRP
jgi:dolichyl-phosphate-mannose--protein O-mannosyl transferase